MKVVDVIQEENGWTHIKWQMENITANMLDWHWSNMEKDFILWHPDDHTELLEWPVPVTKDRFIGAIHLAPQKRKGTEVELMRLRYYDLTEVAQKYRDLIVHEHVVMVGRCGIGRTAENDGPPVKHRLHQYSPTEFGVEGISTACNPTPNPDIEVETRLNMAWVEHAIIEFGNFENFLADLYTMWSVVKNPDLNVFHSLKVERVGNDVRYINLK
jgi:hypothetical protein